MARNNLKFKEFSDKTQEILEEIDEESFNDIEKDPEVYLFHEDDDSGYENVMEAGVRLYASDRKIIFRGKTSDGRIFLVAADNETSVRNWLQDWIPEEEEDDEDMVA